MLCFERPVVVDGKVTGVLFALVSVRSLSEFISDIEADFGDNAFVLYGRDRVLAHPLMAYGYPDLNALTPLPRQAVFGDPVLASMWEEDSRAFLESELIAGTGGHAITLGDEVYSFLFREVAGYADRPLVIGTYFRSSDLSGEFLRLKWALLACLVILIGSVATAAITGKRIAIPVRRLADGAKRIHGLDLQNVPRIPGSFFKELNEASLSFNAMLDGLRWFERYVPKSLVTRLMQQEGDATIRSSEREVTVMFTDIVGFTRLSEQLSAVETADLLNQHFSLIAACIEVEGGTIDKYIGDSVMAVWGAPEPYKDGADRACRASLAITEALRADNEARVHRGQPAIGVRVGIHSGPVVVGNIGSPGRINYTVVGDTVNTAKRLDEVAKTVQPNDGSTLVVVSGEAVGALGGEFCLLHLGPRRMRGKSKPIEVFILRQPADPVHRRAA